MKKQWKLSTAYMALLSATCLTAVPLAAQAADYPNKPITFVVASAAGGILDTIGRIVARGMEKMGQPVVVQNVPGGGSSLGTAAVARAPADGYTIGMVATSHAINPSVYASLPYDTLRDFVTISHTVNLTNVLIVNPSVPAANVQEFIAMAKREPGKFPCGSAGNGQSNHLSLEMFNTETGIKLNHVPYRGSAPALNDVLGGVLTCMFVDVLSAKQHIAAGKVKALAVSSSERVAELPNVPTFAQAGMKEFDANSWLAVVVRTGTPQDVIDRLGKSVAQTMKEPEVRQRLLSMGIEPVGALPSESQRFIEKEVARYSSAVKSAGVKID
ncbi:MAG: tripartite tricarboxylate transporter substrate binding protein [Hydrogenophaga sp.]|uniref:Bug family tripartite tricarboxylate transporter substrate binding protein n=1 Tax=Hydrogenophaga sp. TaxID=1904254 RepID=UPI00271783FE|nr:tripartite tricarboxylate transporter substrate binding protein [Hydrogenophaga sp.]MDO9504270.1 tripartite tricarboxylate transporter substrate binding protein [Hydrogenophaga sp.]MDZ4283900.1 tripartite tricarboxylate transporter substrate binding protein [Hydrogenophaga sp.]